MSKIIFFYFFFIRQYIKQLLRLASRYIIMQIAIFVFNCKRWSYTSNWRTIDLTIHIYRRQKKYLIKNLILLKNKKKDKKFQIEKTMNEDTIIKFN